MLNLLNLIGEPEFVRGSVELISQLTEPLASIHFVVLTKLVLAQYEIAISLYLKE